MARRRLPVFFRQAEADALVAAAWRPKDRLVLLVMLACGVRVSELTGLEIPDLDLDRSILIVRHGKGDRDRSIPMPRWLADTLRIWIGDRRVGYVFPSPRGDKRMGVRTVQCMIKRVAKKAGLPGVDVPRRVSPHKCRHTFATLLLDSGANLGVIKDLLGHASLATTEIYAHTLPERLRSAVEKLAFGGTPATPSPSAPRPDDAAA